MRTVNCSTVLVLGMGNRLLFPKQTDPSSQACIVAYVMSSQNAPTILTDFRNVGLLTHLADLGNPTAALTISQARPASP